MRLLTPQIMILIWVYDRPEEGSTGCGEWSKVVGFCTKSESYAKL
jgi:hypothetical protein